MGGCLEGLGKMFLYVIGAIVGGMIIIWLISLLIN
jgi:hypothetical protein